MEENTKLVEKMEVQDNRYSDRRVCMMDEMHGNPKLSIIVPAYNIEGYIDRCVESILGQTYRNLEIILVDDGSKDATGRICDKYANKDRRIKVIHKENGGLVSARKAGVLKATGEYVAQVDGDDWIEPEMYEKLINKISDADVIISGMYRDYKAHIVREINKIDSGTYEKDALEKIYQSMIYTGSFFERGIQPHICNCLYKKEIITRNQMAVPDEVNIGEDAACLYTTLLDAKKIILTNDSYYHYVMRENSVMGLNDSKELYRYKVLYGYLSKRFQAYSKYNEQLHSQLDYLMIYLLLLKEIPIFQTKDNPLFPYKDIEPKSKVVLVGRGRFGTELWSYLNKSKILDILMWVDCEEDVEFRGTAYDYVLIAVLVKEIADAIEERLKIIGVPEQKIKRVDNGEIDRNVKRVEDLLG